MPGEVWRSATKATSPLLLMEQRVSKVRKLKPASGVGSFFLTMVMKEPSLLYRRISSAKLGLGVTTRAVWAVSLR